MKIIEIPESLKTVPVLQLSIVGMHMSMVGWRFANESFNYLCRNPYLLEFDEYASIRQKYIDGYYQTTNFVEDI